MKAKFEEKKVVKKIKRQFIHNADVHNNSNGMQDTNVASCEQLSNSILKIPNDSMPILQSFQFFNGTPKVTYPLLVKRDDNSRLPIKVDEWQIIKRANLIYETRNI